MELYGLLITKNDHEILAEWCAAQLSLYDAVVCLDGSENDDTAFIAAAYPEKIVYLHERDYRMPRKSDHALRRVAHRELVRRLGYDNWVMCCHADEFCYHDPRKAAVRADAEGCDSVAWFSLHFLPHPDDLADWPRLRRLPVRGRVRHYHWGHAATGLPWVEQRLYRNGPHLSWDRHSHGSTAPHGLLRHASFHPILRHYKVFTADLDFYEASGNTTFFRHHWAGLEQRTGLPFPVRHTEDLFVARYENYAHCDRFDGTFDHPWNMGDEYRPDVLDPWDCPAGLQPARDPEGGPRESARRA